MIHPPTTSTPHGGAIPALQGSTHIEEFQSPRGQGGRWLRKQEARVRGTAWGWGHEQLWAVTAQVRCQHVQPAA